MMIRRFKNWIRTRSGGLCEACRDFTDQEMRWVEAIRNKVFVWEGKDV